jgi:hypothetical protein
MGTHRDEAERTMIMALEMKMDADNELVNDE